MSRESAPNVRTTPTEPIQDFARLIEHAFPLQQASLDSVHEKNVRHGHISTLHVWPARRPLAAARAALIATLLPDPGTAHRRRELCEKIGGKIVTKVERKKMPSGQIVERVKHETEGGVLAWGQETTNSSDIEWFRQKIRTAYGGRAPRVLDPFAGGGAIPLEAMRLGCEVTALDINPVAWFILKCTLEYPHKLAGHRRPLPAFIINDEEFMQTFYKANPNTEGCGKATDNQQEMIFAAGRATQSPDADLAWHVRAWGHWVLGRLREQLSRFYPVYADFEPIKRNQVAYEHRPMELVPLRSNGAVDIDALNGSFTREYLADKRNPRWIPKPTVAYLWARTVECKACRAILPLLKTRWLCKTERQRVLLTMEPNQTRSGVTFGIKTDVPSRGGSTAQKREHDRRVGAGTMSRAGAKCPCCGAIMTMEDLRLEGKADRIGQVMTAVMVDGKGKETRLPTEHELRMVKEAETTIPSVFADVPFGLPEEEMPSENALGMRVPKYGIDRWHKMFTGRQLVALGSLVRATRAATQQIAKEGYDSEWTEALAAFLACGLDRLVDFANVNTQWKIDVPTINHALVRFAIQITWDFAEGNPLGESAGAYILCLNRIATGLDTLSRLPGGLEHPTILHGSAQSKVPSVDLVVTDPPYYDAIPYSDLMDWFYVWLRRTVFDLAPAYERAMASRLGPKWDTHNRDGELIDDASRHGGNAEESKQAYEEGMAGAFRRCADALGDAGRLVIVFANKAPAAWETLVASLIKAGFVVEASWPIQTEQPSRMRGISSAALASSVWLVCRKRAAAARPGWDSAVLDEMRQNIRRQLQEYWDAGIRGPDFVWAATGPALEAYSKHPVVKKADQPGQVMGVTEFLAHVRRMVVDYVVGQVLSGEKSELVDMAAADRLDAPTAYYLLHRHDFGLAEVPAGPCILYAVSCGLSDSDLIQTWDLVVKMGSQKIDDEEHQGDDDEADSDDPEDAREAGSKVRLKAYAHRKAKTMGYEAPNGRSVPLIDRVHRLLHLWRAGDIHKVDEYLDEYGLRRHELFRRLVQSLIELSEAGGDERALLESLSNHIGAKGTRVDVDQLKIRLHDA